MKDTVTIVTGGSQGIGKYSEFLATKGGDIAIFDVIDGSEVVNYIREKGQRSEFYQVDVSNFHMVGEAVDRVVRDMGRVSNLVNNAGITVDKLLLRMKEEDWDRVCR